MCERINNPQDYIARLILLKYERPQSFDVPIGIRPNSKEYNEIQKAMKEKQQVSMFIKKTLDDFFTHYVRLSIGRCRETCLATLQAVYYIIKGKATKQIDPHFALINHFYMFGSMADILKYQHNRDYAIFDMKKNNISFMQKFFQFFAQILMFEDLSDPETDMFSGFLANSLQFLDLQEMAELLVDFNKDFEGLINPLFKLLFYRYEEKEG